MPIYEFECPKGHRFEEMLSFDAPRTKKCPKCGKKAERLISMPNFVLKGDGWYSTDSRKEAEKKTKKAAPADKPAESGAKETKETKETAKPEKTEKKESKTKDKKAD